MWSVPPGLRPSDVSEFSLTSSALTSQRYLFEELASINDTNVFTQFQWKIPLVAGDDEIDSGGKGTGDKFLVGLPCTPQESRPKNRA